MIMLVKFEARLKIYTEAAIFIFTNDFYKYLNTYRRKLSWTYYTRYIEHFEINAILRHGCHD